MTRILVLAGAMLIGLAFAGRVANAQTPKPRDASLAFERELGEWRTHVKRLRRPLSGHAEWLEYEGTTTVTPLLGGRANVAELRVAGPSGRIEGAALRVFRPAEGKWSIHYFSASDGEITAPLVGTFEDGVGRFEGDDRMGDRPIRVRFEMREATPGTWRFEQAFSADGGRTWETNWVAVDTRAPS